MGRLEAAGRGGDGVTHVEFQELGNEEKDGGGVVPNVPFPEMHYQMT